MEWFTLAKGVASRVSTTRNGRTPVLAFHNITTTAVSARISERIGLSLVEHRDIPKCSA